MAFEGYLTGDEMLSIAEGIVATIGYGPAERAMFLAALPRPVRDALPAGLVVAPRIQAFMDLSGANNWERMTDGTVPILPFLRLAVRLAGGSEAMRTAVEALGRIDSQTTGAPRIDLTQVPEVKERIVGRDDMVPFGFFERGLARAASVVRLEVPRFTDGAPHLTHGSQTRYLGTGWIVGPNLLITNHHVLNARNDGEAAAGQADLDLQTKGTEARFDYDQRGVAGIVTHLGELVCADPVLDYAIARLDDQGRAPLPFSPRAVADVTRDSYFAVNIIQHPEGRPKLFGVRNNLVTAATEQDLRYFTDTLGGSSGSPVFDDDWNVVGLHRGSTVAKDVQYQGRDVAYVNVGAQIHAILAHIEANFGDVAGELGL